MTAIRNVLPLEEYVDWWICEEALEFLRYPGSKPLFLWCGFCGPHGPVDPPAPYDELYPLDRVPLPRGRCDDPQGSPKGRPSARWDEETIRRWIAYYWGLVSLIDDMTGRMVALLEERGLLENTLIAYTSDHGDMAGDYHMMGKGNFYEEVIHVPLILAAPSSRQEERVSGLVEAADLAPTVLDYAGVAIPEQMPTRSLRPLIEGRGQTRESVLCEYQTNDRTRRGTCVRTERHKYAYWGQGEVEELYDLEEDPDELQNLASDPSRTAELSACRQVLLDRLQTSQQAYHRDEAASARDMRIWLG
jgi:arylsulfatase A-like enzyme